MTTQEIEVVEQIIKALKRVVEFLDEANCDAPLKVIAASCAIQQAEHLLGLVTLEDA